jgi:hypothetical protein
LAVAVLVERLERFWSVGNFLRRDDAIAVGIQRGGQRRFRSMTAATRFSRRSSSGRAPRAVWALGEGDGGRKGEGEWEKVAELAFHVRSEGWRVKLENLVSFIKGCRCKDRVWTGR